MTRLSNSLNPHGAVWMLRVEYATSRPLSTSPIHTTYVAVDAVGETEARMLAAQMVETQVGPTFGRPHPEVVLSVEIIGCEV